MSMADWATSTMALGSSPASPAAGDSRRSSPSTRRDKKRLQTLQPTSLSQAMDEARRPRAGHSALSHPRRQTLHPVSQFSPCARAGGQPGGKLTPWRSLPPRCTLSYTVAPYVWLPGLVTRASLARVWRCVMLRLCGWRGLPKHSWETVSSEVARGDPKSSARVVARNCAELVAGPRRCVPFEAARLRHRESGHAS